MGVNGFNPLRWDCDSGKNCFNVKRRPKIEVFADCFPGLINFGDVDGLVEINGYFCLLEWKGPGGQLLTAQKILATRFTTHPGNIVFVVFGDAETMEVSGYDVFEGRHRTHYAGGLDDLKEDLKQWAARALAAPRPSGGTS